MNPTTPAVRISGLRKHYPGTDRPAVAGLSLEIEAGSLFALVGASGCGKTTTMRCIAGLEDPDEGEIYLGDTLVFSSWKGINVPPYRRSVGMVFQSYAIWPHMTVYNNVAYPLKNVKLSRTEIRSKVVQALEMVGLVHMQDRPAPRLSGGEQQRVALARALVASPSVLLLDEPLSNLDAKLRDQMRFELQEIQQSLGLTAVYVTHDQDEAFSLSQVMAIMDKGELIELGEPASVYSVPRTTIGARFLGVSAEVRGRTVGRDDDIVIVETAIGELRCRSRQPCAAESAVVVYIRPEDVHVANPDVVPPVGSCHVRANLTRTVYHGSSYEWTAHVNGVRVRGRSLSDSGEAARLRESVGEEVCLWISITRCVEIDQPELVVAPR